MKKSRNRFDRVDVTSRLINMVLDMPLHHQLELLRRIDKSRFSGARKHVRRPYVFVVDCETEEAYFQEYIRDISGGGLFLRSDKPFSADQEIRMTFQVPNHSHVFNISGKVVRICPDGIGVQFIRHMALEGKPCKSDEEEMASVHRSA